MCFVYVKHDVGICFFQLGQTGERSHIAVHAEDAFRHDDDSGKIMMVLFQQGLQLRVVLMAVADTFCSRQADAVYQAGVYQFVRQVSGCVRLPRWQKCPVFR